MSTEVHDVTPSTTHTQSADVFTPEVLADMLRCSVKTIEDRARRGDLPGLKFGDGWVFPAAALFQRLNELALEQARQRGQPTPSRAHALHSIEKPKRAPPALPKLP